MYALKDNTVAVTFYHDTNFKVLLVDVERNQLIKTIELAHYCYGVSSDGEALVISQKEARKTTILNLKDMTEKNLSHPYFTV
ncbi:Hypothetical predicted protein [Mytilus galloprovincialis]|uniref:Uncharacterized protein n=1 Tax=Mytilus galloprovincialis TaxID=29158 RepID=A0A8B6EAY1_MYTGA|nr:Hypothetical predicted protein [Mytilus galloprovincialis]